MKKNSVSEFELEKQDFKIKLKRGVDGMIAAPMQQVDDASVVAYAPPPLTIATSSHLPAVPAQQPASTELEIKSPMIGTFYRAPSPESVNYADIGTEVNPETVVCIIEAMKVMNEIKSEAKGIITQVLVENAKPVEFGQPLFKFRPT